MAPKLKFSDGEKVLCFHGPLIYEAKCLKSLVSKEKHIKYLIHYAGWNKNWDEWVPESRVLKYNESNVQKQKEVQKAHSSQPAKTKKASTKGRKSEPGGSVTPTPTKLPEPVVGSAPPKIKEKEKEKDKDKEKEKDKDKDKDKEKEKEKEKDKDSESRASTPHAETVSQDSGSDVPNRKKRGRLDLSVESEEQFLNKVEVRIKVPEELRTWLVDDWDIINRQQKLVNLPAKLTVFQIVDNYLTHKKSSKIHNQQKENVLTDFTEGVKEYFNTALGSQLLYKFERPQYSEILQNYPDTPMSKIYGAIHILRLFVKIGPMLTYTSLDEKSMQNLVSHIQDLLKYMVSNRATLFNLQDYGNATPEYHRKVL